MIYGGYGGKGERGRSGLQCKFVIKLRADDTPILEEIHERLGFGRVIPLPSRYGQRPQTEFTVWDKAGCVKLVEFFDRYPLRAKKARDFAIWREAVAEWNQHRTRNAHFPQDWSRMWELREEMTRTRSFEDADPDLVAELIEARAARKEDLQQALVLFAVHTTGLD